MTQLAAVFPPNVSHGFKGGPKFKTTIPATGAEFSYPNSDWDQPLGRWVASHAARTEQDFGKVLGHFMIALGMGNQFPFKDWNDFKVPDFSGVGVIIDGQFYKRYSPDDGVTYFDRIIRLPKSGTIVGGHRDSNGNFIADGGLGTIDYTTGQMAGGTSTAWEGEFYFLCRYGDDAMEAEAIDGPEEGRIVGWSGIEIEEVRP